MHTITWLIWLAAAVAAASLAPNPLYLGLIMLAAAQVFLACRDSSPLTSGFSLFARGGALLFASYLIFGLITVGGARGATTLIELPALRLPDLLGGLVLGGPITAEALAWGATRGLAIWSLMLIFGTFNALVDHYRLLRLAPRSLFHAGLAVTIAVAFVPSLLRSIGEIGEAQRARGHRFGRPRSWVALVSPLLAGSLEKSVQLAESLDSRGYGRTGSGDRAQGRAQLGVIAATLLLAGGAFGWLYYGGAMALPASAMLAAGALALALTMRALGRQVRRSSYRRERWRGRDSLAALAALGCALALALLRLGDTGLVYYPFPQIAPPAFDLRAGLAVLLLAAPAALAPPPPPGRRRRAALRRAAAAPLTPCPSPSGGDGIPEQDAPESPSPLVGEGVGGFGATAAGRDVASALATGEAVCNLQ